MDVEAYNADELAAMGLEEVFAGASFAYPKLHERYTAETDLKHFPVVESASGATIPGGAAVLEAKKKRERLRAIGAPNTTAVPSDEFISLSLTKRSGDEDDGTPARESRLEREEDDLGDGEDGEAILQLDIVVLNADCHTLVPQSSPSSPGLKNESHWERKRRKKRLSDVELVWSK